MRKIDLEIEPSKDTAIGTIELPRERVRNPFSPGGARSDSITFQEVSGKVHCLENTGFIADIAAMNPISMNQVKLRMIQELIPEMLKYVKFEEYPDIMSFRKKFKLRLFVVENPR